jgi:hypothetical protein
MILYRVNHPKVFYEKTKDDGCAFHIFEHLGKGIKLPGFFLQRVSITPGLLGKFTKEQA